MKTKFFALISALAIVGVSAPALAMPMSDFSLPPKASQVAENVFYLGEARDAETNSLVEGYAIIHYKKTKAKKNEARPRPGRTACYGFLSSGAKWKYVEPWVFNGTNSSGLSASLLFENFVPDVLKWEDAADGVTGNAISKNILGDGVETGNTLVADTVSPDGVNEVYFGNIEDSNAIAVTIVWGVFGGPRRNRELVEWDMIFDEVDYDWSLSGAAGAMDFENVATHELGHVFGLADLYNSSCADETMYGYADNGEIKKRDLNSGDIAGIKELYK
jgi:hypothetical protein